MIAAVRSHLSAASGEARSSPPAPAGSWEALPALARLHRLSGVVARAVTSAGAAEAIPATALEEIRNDARATAASALASIAPLAAVTRALASAGIGALVWKGPALGLQAWGEPGTRASVDLDIVIAPHDRARARAVVGALGWESAHSMTVAQERAVYRGRGAWELRHRAHAVLLEAHWEFSALRYPGRLQATDVIARSEELTIGGLRIRVPSPSDNLILLAQHGSKHGWSSLEDVAVFAAILARHPDSTHAASRRAEEVGASRALRLGGALSAKTFGVPLPEPLGTAVRADTALPRLVKEVEARWLSGDVAWRPTLRWDLAWTHRHSDRARLLLRSLLDPTLQEWLAVRLPDPLLPLYRAIRPVRLLLRGVRR